MDATKYQSVGIQRGYLSYSIREAASDGAGGEES